MSLFRLTYCSRATAPPDYATLRALMEVAQTRNEQDGITGMLCYSGGYFFQCLEGPRVAVSRTMARIYADPRHRDIVLVDAWVVRDRVFPGMRAVSFELASRKLADSNGDAKCFSVSGCGVVASGSIGGG